MVENFINFSILKNFLARAHFRARAQNILPPMPKNHDFWVFTAIWDSARAARGNARAPKIFWKCNLDDNISLQIFLFGHNSKSEFFRAIWNLNFFFENSIFSQNFQILKNLRFFQKNQIFWWKNTNFKFIYSNQFERYENVGHTYGV